jgi:ligand-binding SRPBCC domain-containing protein
MQLIHLTNFIAAPIDRVFDLSRSITLHKQSMTKFGEKAIEGRLGGLIGLNETVTWKAKHLLKERRLKIKITSYNKPHIFIDEQVEGDFKKMKHEHHFKQVENGTIMIDQFYFESPHGQFGKLIDTFYLNKYLKKLLEERNRLIKKHAEGNTWKQYLT